MKLRDVIAIGMFAVCGFAMAQGGATGVPDSPGAAQTPASPFPPVNAKFFTATTPTVATVDAFLRAIWGYDENRIWQVAAIQKTPAPGVSKVTVFVSEKTAARGQVQTTQFFITPDGKHAIADAVIDFGATPFADTRKLMQERANGPWRGAAGKELELVEFADMQCPHCKDAQVTMDQLVRDFPNAHVVFQAYPLTDIHPFAFKAAAYGVCVAKTSNAAFFQYAQAVFDTQESLTTEMNQQALNAAVQKAGGDPVAVGTCAESAATKDAVNASIHVAEDAGVDQTPMLAINGHLVPIGAMAYETLKKIVAYQAGLDGVATGAVAAKP